MSRTVSSGSPVRGGRIVTRRVSTTDATVTTIATIPIPDNASVLISVDVAAFRTNGADQAAYKKAALIYRRGGVATLQGTVQSVMPDVESDASWDSDIAVSGNNALIQVTGVIGKDINWKSEHVVEEVE